MPTGNTADKSKLTRSEFAFLIFTAAITITVVSANSPLYPFNPWNDANCFLTLGRGIINGLIPYKDLYEQKGPVLYFVYALAALFSDSSFTGVWIIECVMASVFAVFSWKTAKLFTEPRRFTLFIMPVLLALTYSTGLFNFGGNAEELCFPLLTVLLYTGLRSIVCSNGLPGNKEAIMCGAITAVLFWIKYTFIGFSAGFCLYVILFSVKRKNFAGLWSLVWRFLSGFIIPAIPVLIYFAANGSLGYLWEAYFYNNIVFYHSDVVRTGLDAIPVISTLYIPIHGIIHISGISPMFGIMLLLAVISVFFVGKEYRKKAVFLFVLTFALTEGVVFAKCAFFYYYLYLSAYCFCLILIPVIRLLNLLGSNTKRSTEFIKGSVSGFLLVCYIVVMLSSKNTYLIMREKEYLVQYRYAEIIKQTPNARLLTYDVMDSGFYTAAGLLPSNRFFCFLNIESTYPAILEEQNRLIAKGYFDYIVTSDGIECDWDNYELIREENDLYVNYTRERSLKGYRLYKRIRPRS